ncbi:DUF3106 domain-containing protein [Fontisphaera persica]|uniref:DUF3106 domain-containing protein n=1 Tax=Fontisphaera persica TaxID=2974023 RepID=UPI0024C06EEB|nr:DUF3106 domain-containing protein [Fontisphaera persica]WCJ60353.1 DUF3106 domain-containing protein [Fontisphaera persica]
MKRIVWLAVGMAGVLWAATPPAPTVDGRPPLPPLGAPPMQAFRELLNTNAAGRQAFLSKKSPEQRQLFEQKLAEYEGLSPAQRELRLTLTDLRHYLMLFLNLPESWRETYLAQLPERYRPLVVERLKIWDRLDEATRKELLQNEDLLAYLVRLENAPPVPQGLFLYSLPGERRLAIEAALKTWNQTPPHRQQAMLQRFKHFFHLSESEQRQVLEALPPQERQTPERFLAALFRLPASQREKYAEAVNRFLSLSPAEQEQFLRNAMTWKSLTPEQREIVRDMVNKIPPLPPLPPGLLQSTGPSLGGFPATSGKR